MRDGFPGDFVRNAAQRGGVILRDDKVPSPGGVEGETSSTRVSASTRKGGAPLHTAANTRTARQSFETKHEFPRRNTAQQGGVV